MIGTSTFVFVLIHIRNKGEVGAVKHVEALQYKRVLFSGILFVIFISCLSVLLSCLFIAVLSSYLQEKG